MLCRRGGCCGVADGSRAENSACSVGRGQGGPCESAATQGKYFLVDFCVFRVPAGVIRKNQVLINRLGSRLQEVDLTMFSNLKNIPDKV